MPRLQVLHLPNNPDDDTPRWALVVDQAVDLPQADQEALRTFALQAGGQGCVVLSTALDLTQNLAFDIQGSAEDEELVRTLSQQLANAAQTTTRATPQQGAGQRRLPPPNTTEGKLARVWGGAGDDSEDPQT